ncbi:MAG: FAD:protein FMN transferase [Vicinamibacterales bacterium]
MTTVIPQVSARSTPLPSRRRFLSRTPANVIDTAGQWLRVQRRAMACSFEITLDQADAQWLPHAQAALNQIDALEAQLTVFRDTSAISDINRRAAREDVQCDADVFSLLGRCDELSRASSCIRANESVMQKARLAI